MQFKLLQGNVTSMDSGTKRSNYIQLAVPQSDGPTLGALDVAFCRHTEAR